MRLTETGMNRVGMRWKIVVAACLLAVMGASSVWADGFYNIDNTGYNANYNRVYDRGQVLPQYFPRIDPDTRPSQMRQFDDPPLRASTRTTQPQPKALSTKIADGFNDLWRSPTVRSGVVGGGIGLGASALTKHMGLWHGTWVGVAYGAGFGLIDEVNFFKKHPLMRRSAKGAVVGLGAAAVSGAAALGPAAAVGAGVGAGIHALKLH
jgi:hypothetical protein